VEVIAETLQRLRADGIAMLLVEQNAMLTFAATSHCLVLENGEIALAGPSAELRANPASAACIWACYAAAVWALTSCGAYSLTN
jgi:ABC-type branched-subunit amino acid transport system ATPase component